MIHVIQQNTLTEINLRRTEISWQTRAICTFIASTVEDNNARDKLFSSASKLTLLEDEVDDTTDDNRTLEDIIENGSIAAALEKNNKRKGQSIDSMRMSAP